MNLNFEKIHPVSVLLIEVFSESELNVSSLDKSFSKLKINFKETFTNQKTSLKMKSNNGEVLNLPYDNFFVSKMIQSKNSEVILFYKDFRTLEEARKISDHCPIKISIK